MRNTLATAILAATIILPSAIFAAPMTYALPDESATFKDRPGVDTARANCATCHSTDDINEQPSKQGAAFWTAEVQKMIKAYGAPVTDVDAKVIAVYLAATYGDRRPLAAVAQPATTDGRGP